jgi:hypothetical protein
MVQPREDFPEKNMYKRSISSSEHKAKSKKWILEEQKRPNGPAFHSSIMTASGEPGGVAQKYQHISQRSFEGFTRESVSQI